HRLVRAAGRGAGRGPAAAGLTRGTGGTGHSPSVVPHMSIRVFALRAVAVFALGVCSAILAEYVFAGQAFCSFEGGCGEVFESAYGRPLGVPLPVYGPVGFGLVLALSLAPGRRAASVLTWLAVGAGVTGAALIGIQAAVLGQFCRLCLLVDGSA